MTLINFQAFALEDKIEELESFRRCAYYDHGNYAIGFGQQTINGLKVVKGQCITKEVALLNLYHKLEGLNQQLNKWLKANNTTLNSNQQDAILLFIYNIGFRGFTTSDVAWALEYDKTQVANKLLQYTRANGKVLEGLEKRRAYEGFLFNTKVKK